MSIVPSPFDLALDHHGLNKVTRVQSPDGGEGESNRCASDPVVQAAAAKLSLGEPRPLHLETSTDDTLETVMVGFFDERLDCIGRRA